MNWISVKDRLPVCVECSSIDPNFYFDCDSWQKKEHHPAHESASCVRYVQLRGLENLAHRLDNCGFNSIYRFHVKINNFLYDLKQEESLCFEHAEQLCSKHKLAPSSSY